MLSKIYICPVIVVGAVITCKMFDAGAKHLSATDSQLKVLKLWMKKFNLQITFMSIHFFNYIVPSSPKIRGGVLVFKICTKRGS